MPVSAVRLSLLCAVLTLLLCACHPASRTIRAGGPAADETDTACSYFYFLWGRNAELQLEFEEALEAYEKAVICDPKATYIQGKIPILLLRLDRADEAALWLHAFLAKNQDNLEMRLLYANILLGQRKTEAALQQFRRIQSLHPDDPAVTLPLAEMYMVTNHPEEARAILERVLGKDEKSYQAHLLMARLLRSGRDLEAGFAHYARALELNWSAEVQAEQAELLTQQGRYGEAEALYRDIISREEESESASLELIRLLLGQNKDDQALEELRKLGQSPDKRLWVDETMARIHVRHKRYEEARQILEQAIKRDNSSSARFLLVAILQEEHKDEEALRQVRLIDNRTPEYPQALALMVSLYERLNRVDDAVLFLERNIAGTITRHPAMYPLLARLHEQQGMSAVARKVLEQGLEQYPDNEELLYAYGVFLEDKSEHTTALSVMNKLLELDPDHVGALNFVGYSWADAGINLEKALGYIRRALTQQPDNPAIRDSLGWVLYRLGRRGEALAELEKASQQSEDPEVLEHLAEVLLAEGKREEALTAYKKALELIDDNSDAALRQRLRRKLNELDPSTPLSPENPLPKESDSP